MLSVWADEFASGLTLSRHHLAECAIRELGLGYRLCLALRVVVGVMASYDVAPWGA